MWVLSATAYFKTLKHTASNCNTLQHTTTYCNTLQHTAKHCNALQHTTLKRAMNRRFMLVLLALIFKYELRTYHKQFLAFASLPSVVTWAQNLNTQEKENEKKVQLLCTLFTLSLLPVLFA